MKIRKFIILLIAMAILCGCSAVSNTGNGVLEFFGFNQPAKPTAPATNDSEQKAQNAPQADADPFGVQSNVAPTQGGGLANLDWDDIDPALIEMDDDEDMASKTGGSVQDDWEDDPFLWSFSESSFENAPLVNEQKQVPVNPEPVNPAPANPVPMNPEPLNPAPVTPRPVNPVPVNPDPIMGNTNTNNGITFYQLQNNPVFRPMRELPRTGITSGMQLDLSASVAFTPTNMSLSIPVLNVSEDIVVVPLVDDNYPVEGLDGKIGLLEGSGPGKEDLFVLAAHNHLNAEEQGPFVELSAMKESDLIFIRGSQDASRTFVVYANEKFASDDIEGLLSYAKPGCMILITCEDESIEGGYINRRVIFAEPKED